MPVASVLLNTPEYFHYAPNFPEHPYSSDRLSHMLVVFSPPCEVLTQPLNIDLFKYRGTDY